MGAHFGLRLVEGLKPADLAGLQVPLLVTSSHEGEWLHQANLLLALRLGAGSQGQGGRRDRPAGGPPFAHCCPARCGEESLNVAAAAAICLHASATGRLAPPA